ncbi:MAG TPA: Mur ligase family protein [Xanthomonadales bacterium]|nr:Mur ligase family protein [Xanthomonadales bacterium]
MEILDSLKLIGPNRRSEKTVIEAWLAFTGEETAHLQTIAGELVANSRDRLVSLGIARTEVQLLEPSTDGSPGQIYAAIAANIALLLQQQAGHRVSFHASFPGIDSHKASLVVEFEHGDTGLESARLALAVLQDVVPEVHLTEPQNSLEEELQKFFEEAPTQVLPQQTQDLIDAAERFDIPCKKLDRDPYEGLEGDFRIRPHSMLKLGQAIHQRVIDGSFPIDSGEALAQMVHDRAALLHALKSLGAPMPNYQVCANAQQGAASAEQLGFPLVVKPRRIDRASKFSPVSLNLDNQEQVNASLSSALRSCGGAVLESHVPGKSYRALLSGRQLLAVLELSDGVAVADVLNQLNPETASLLGGIGQRLNLPLLTLTLVTEDISQPPGEAGRVVNMDLAPDLDKFIPVEGQFQARSLRGKAADSIVQHLFPPGTPARIPLVSVTGTNGKSTVCTMVSRMMQQRGFSVGLAATTGLYANREMIEAGDRAGGQGHNQILDSTQFDFAVLETARGAVSGLGLMFDHSDVAVCTNVSSDHLGERGIETVEQMAELKQFIVDRARRAVVLNADNRYSAGMFKERPGCQTWIVSAELSLDQLNNRFGPGNSFCFAHSNDGVEWISLHHSGKTEGVMPVSQIPATFNGIARFNVSNSLQAIAAAFSMGASVEDIRLAMSGYVTDFQTSPGRLNVFEGLPFKVIFDFAHNEESHRALREIVDREEVSGRKILLFSRRGDTTDERILEEVPCIADGYDLFISFDNPKQHGREPGDVSAILKSGLIECGVEETRIITIDTDSAFMKALNLCREGDLLVACTTTKHLYRDWEQITTFKPGC